MAQQTAVNWLIEQLRQLAHNPETKYQKWGEAFEQAKQMEKEQIMKAVDRGYDEGCKFPEDMTLKNSEQYYNETYCEYSGLPSVKFYEEEGEGAANK